MIVIPLNVVVLLKSIVALKVYWILLICIVGLANKIGIFFNKIALIEVI